MGRQLKQSVKVFQSFMLNLRLPEEKRDNCKIRLFTSELIFLGEIYFLFGEEEVEQNSLFLV